MPSSRLQTRLFTAALALGLAFPLGAQVLMLDFGGTAVTNASRTNSPYHTANGSFTDTTWNSQGQGNDNTLTWSDSTTATGLSYTAFKNNSSGQTAMVAGGWSASFSGSAVNTGIYATPSVGLDGYMMSTTLTDARAIGIQVSGLAHGTYDIYIAGRNTNYSASAYTVNYYASAASATGNFNFGTYDSESVTYAAGTTDKTSSWSFDPNNASESNYVKLTVSITAANPYLNIATMGEVGSGMAQGVFNSIQIVTAIPEPSSYALLAGAGGLMIACSRRRARTL